MSTGILIARFQAPYLSDTAIRLIKKIQSSHREIAIVLGVSQIPGTKSNPFDFETRRKMVEQAFPEMNVLELPDHPSDEIWSKNLDELVSKRFPNITLYGSKDRVAPFYSGTLKLVELPNHVDFTEEVERKFSLDFKEGKFTAYQSQYDKVFPTVDIALFRNDKSEILLGKKKALNQWRLIGGFADADDENFEGAAQRELVEECGEIETANWSYETSAKIDDWRYRFERDKIITSLFSCDYVSGKIKASDDIVDVKWFKVSELNAMITNASVVDEHLGLMRFIFNKYGKA